MNPIVSPEWLASRLTENRLAILDATLPPVGILPVPDVRQNYVQRHLPGAIFFDIEEFSDRATTLPHMLPSPEQFARQMSALGISNEDTIVIYEQNDIFSAPRAWWMLRTMGVQKVHVLDGGLRTWLELGFPIEAGPVHRPHAHFHASFDSDRVKDFAQIQQMIDEGSQILDARSAGRFNGASPEPRPGIRSGHMPGAINIPYTELTRNNQMKSADELRVIFNKRGVNLEHPMTTSCGSGVTAAVIALALEICGAKDVSLYDGSWADYAQQSGAAIEGAA